MIGVPGAVFLGLGSILGTGIFVSVGLAAEAAGPAVLIAIPIAALLAGLNGLSSAQLAANHPVSGGTYEYGYRVLSPAFGFTAGWMFLCAKSASAAAAALGFGGYALALFGRSGPTTRGALALTAVLALTLVVIGGLQRSSRVNAVIVSITLAGLLAFVLAGIPSAAGRFAEHLHPFARSGAAGILHASALMFVAYTGYARIATLGEEIHEPRRSIPRAIALALLVTLVLYLAVLLVAVGSAGAEDLGAATRSTAAPLEAVAQGFELPQVRHAIAVAAITAMLGVILNLILGLSRVVLAMARRGDLPRGLARLDPTATSPRRAVLLSAALIAGLALTGSVRLAWSFSAFTVLVYYAITNLAALRLTKAERLYPRWVSAAGLIGCAGLAFWVETRVWLAGLALIALGLGWHHLARSQARRALR